MWAIFSMQNVNDAAVRESGLLIAAESGLYGFAVAFGTDSSEATADGSRFGMPGFCGNLAMSAT
jgi:hypothetical protein